jgi:septum formation protein
MSAPSPAAAAPPPLILASASPRRRDLLCGAGFAPVVAAAHGVDETWHTGEHPVLYTRRVAEAKARVVATDHRDAVVLGADTTVWIHPAREPLQKPESRAHAEAMLRELVVKGRHLVTTGFCVVNGRAGTVFVEHVTSEVCFSAPSEAELQAYLDGDEWTDKAGAYAIQGWAGRLVREVVGSTSNVIGLPVREVVAVLRHCLLGEPRAGVLSLHDEDSP